jgi:tRNA-specific adenosine deaminase 1
MIETNLANNVALLVLDTYHSLAKSGKPSVRPNGIPEWSILAGLIAQRKGTHLAKVIAGTLAYHQDNSLRCLSLATGVKCLPSNKVIQAQGLALHDCHAEILALRGFNRFSYLVLQ